MDTLDSMRVFARVVERRSFTLAAQDTGLPRSTVTEAIKHIEKRLGVRLLQRTTRHVSATLDGEAYYRRCLAIIADIEDAEAAFSGVKPHGLLRVDVHGTLMRHFVLPALPDFLSSYPDVRLHLGEGDRLADLVREGMDCVVRVGEPRDSAMIGRRIAMLEEVTCASPDYLEKYGVPATPDDVSSHRMIGFVSSSNGQYFPLEFTVGGKPRYLTPPVAVSVTGAETNVALARLGLGLIQVPRYHVEADLAAGSLVEILAAYPPSPSPVSVLYPHSRQLSPRVRVFIDWLSGVFAKRFGATANVSP
jgi:DNA-binding transcriptional LysR family regulator